MYREVLKQQPDNIYAVNGVGTCLAELGHLAAAKQVKEGCSFCCLAASLPGSICAACQASSSSNLSSL